MFWGLEVNVSQSRLLAMEHAFQLQKCLHWFSNFGKLQHVSASPGGFVSTQMSGPHSHSVQFRGLGQGLKFHISNKYPEMLKLLLWGPHFKNHQLIPSLSPLSWRLLGQVALDLYAQMQVCNKIPSVEFLSFPPHIGLKTVNKWGKIHVGIL